MRTFNFQLSCNGDHSLQQPVILYCYLINRTNDGLQSLCQFVIRPLFGHLYISDSGMEINDRSSDSCKSHSCRHRGLKDLPQIILSVSQITHSVFKHCRRYSLLVSRSFNRDCNRTGNEAKRKRDVAKRILKALIPYYFIFKVLPGLLLTLQASLMLENSPRALLVFLKSLFCRVYRVQEHHEREQRLHPSSCTATPEPSRPTVPIRVTKIPLHGFPPRSKDITICQLAPESQWAGGAA